MVIFLLSACAPQGFDLEVKLENSLGDAAAPITDGFVQLSFGSDTLPAQPVDLKGKAFFKNIDRRYETDSVRLIYRPATPKRWRVTEQNAYTALENKSLRFSIDFPPENTSFMWSVRDKNGDGVVGAKITFDRKFMITTGSNGYFDITLPKPAGEKVHFLIEKDGKVLLDKDIAIFPEYRRLILE